MIHLGNTKDIKKIIDPYFYKPNSSTSKFCNGGALMGLGMAFAATKDKETMDFLIESYKNPGH